MLIETPGWREILERTGVHEKSVTLSHGRTRYFEAGSGPPLILLHGIGFTNGAHRHLLHVAGLAKMRRVICPDFVGFGTGDRLAVDYSLAYLVDFVRELQDALDIPRADIAGYCLGGLVAALLAYESPERARNIALVAMPRYQNYQAFESSPIGPTLFQPPQSPADIERFLRKTMEVDIDYSMLTAAEWEIARIPGAAEHYRRFLRHFFTADTMRRYSIFRRAPRIPHRAVLAFAEDDDWTPIVAAEELVSLLPNATLVRVARGRGAHFFPLREPNLFVEAVASGLD